MPNTYIYNLGAAFYKIAMEHGSRTALLYPSGDRITYEALNERSNKIARALLQLGVRCGDIVCIFNLKSVDAFAAMLACLKIGAVYSNLDVTSPAQRIEKMLATCQPTLVLHEGDEADLPEALGKLPHLRGVGLASNSFADLIAQASGEGLEETDAVTGSDPAYIMFTSGSTGIPKGAVMSHSNVLNLIGWAQETFGVEPEDVFTNVNPVYFDNSVFDFYVSLFSGSVLCPIGPEITGRPKQLVECVNRLGCTVWFSVPSLLVYLLTMRALGEDDLPGIRTIVFGGEGFPKPKLRQLYELFGHRSQLVNVYGPTECTCICSSYVIRERDFDDLHELAPLGHVSPNFDYRIDPLDQEASDCGELLLLGPNVGLGYFNDREQTERSFVRDPSKRPFRCIAYRTGDLVRKSPEGYLHFKGRVDNQIKHMGYRIELEEIEAAFGTLDYIDEVLVVYRRREDGLGQIIAFVSVSSEVAEKQILKDIKEIVPPYMVPRKVNLMATLPKNRNGKVDRKRLQELSEER